MNLDAFKHVLRAAAAIADETVFVVIGSQAILAQFPDAPPELTRSMELDLYPKFRPDLAEVIEGAIGADSPFHGTFGYFADAVGPETAILPSDWESRSLRVGPDAATAGALALCPEIHDLCASKLIAGREKDIAFVTDAVSKGLADPEIIGIRLNEVANPEPRIGLARHRLKRIGRVA